jgi:hypothetical protein
MGRQLIGRAVAVFAVLALLGLIGASAALADLNATEGQQFSGPVTNFPDCDNTPTAIHINWGDGTATSAGTYNANTGDVSGTHTYAQLGDYSGTVTYSSGAGCPTQPVAFTAFVQAATLTASPVTFNATASQGFSGGVATFTDGDTDLTASDFTATIDWGDGSAETAGTIGGSGGNFTVDGAHTYATPGTYNDVSVSVNEVTPEPAPGNEESEASTSTTSTANVAHAPAEFTECPPVYYDTGCQFLIVFTNSGKTVYEDPSQGPYEDDDDSLIGVVNNSSSPIQSLPISVPGQIPFGFDGDGLCDPGGPPLAPGCAVAAGEPAGTTSGAQGDACSFPAPAGEPAKYTEPGATSPNRQNGYEGPTTWFSNVNSSDSAGNVNFSPPLQPGQSTYFSLEEPPSASALVVGGPTGVVLPPPILGQTVNVTVISGTVYVKFPAGTPAADLTAGSAALTKGIGFVQLTEAQQLPVGTQVDARRGTIGLVAATGIGTGLESGDFAGGLYKIGQDAKGKNKGLTTLSLLENAFKGAPSYASCKGKKAADIASVDAHAAKLSSKVLQTLKATAHGKFNTKGKYAAATVLGTKWSISDRCNGTYIAVQRDTVKVHDLFRNLTVIVHAHHHYLAGPGGHYKKRRK